MLFCAGALLACHARAHSPRCRLPSAPQPLLVGSLHPAAVRRGRVGGGALAPAAPAAPSAGGPALALCQGRRGYRAGPPSPGARTLMGCRWGVRCCGGGAGCLPARSTPRCCAPARRIHRPRCLLAWPLAAPPPHHPSAVRNRAPLLHQPTPRVHGQGARRSVPGAAVRRDGSSRKRGGGTGCASTRQRGQRGRGHRAIRRARGSAASV